MLVSHSHKFIYTKTKKTAGTSVESYFDRYCLSEVSGTPVHAIPMTVSEAGIVGGRGMEVTGEWFHHMPAVTIRDKLGVEVWNSYHKFCVIRHPYDKAVSAFFHLNREEAQKHIADRDNLRLLLEFWILSGKSPNDRATYVIDGTWALDTALRYETLTADLEKLCERLGIPWEPARLPRWKSGLRPQEMTYERLLTNEAKEHLQQQYRFEFEFFGYEP